MDKKTVDQLNEKLKGKSALEILKMVSAEFKQKIRFASSMGVEDQVITHMIADNQLPVEVFTLDTGRMFPETYEIIEKTESRYNIKISIYFPDAQDVENMVNEKGINLFYHSIENRKL